MLKKDTVEAVGFHLRNSTIIWISINAVLFFGNNKSSIIMEK